MTKQCKDLMRLQDQPKTNKEKGPNYDGHKGAKL